MQDSKAAGTFTVSSEEEGEEGAAGSGVAHAEGAAVACRGPVPVLEGGKLGGGAAAAACPPQQLFQVAGCGWQAS